MDKPFLHKSLNLFDAISELKLDNLTHAEAVNRILQYAEHDGLRICFNSYIIGYDVNKPTAEPECHLDVSGPLVAKEDVVYGQNFDGELVLKHGSYTEIEPDYIAVYKFQCNDIEYDSVNEPTNFIVPTNIEKKCFYIDRDDLNIFISRMESKPFIDTSSTKNNTQNISDAGYLDPTHRNYSEELHAAINAWLHANSGDDKKYGSSFKKRIENFLKTCKFDLNDTAIKRIATVANSKNNKRNTEK